MHNFIGTIKTFKKGLFVYSDPGGAKPILAFVLFLKKNISDIELSIISDREYEFSNDFHKVTIVKNIDSWLAENQTFDYVFTGTSYTSNLEKKVLHWAINKNIETFSYVDHWSNIKERFRLGENYVFSNNILVLDKKAKEIAINEGIDSKRVKIVKNSYLNYLESWQPQITREQFFLQLELTDNKKHIVLYAPDSVSNHHWKELYGSDESVILEEILETLIRFEKKDFYFLVQPHPNQNISLLQNILNKNKFKNISAEILSETDVPLILYYSDIIIGQFSNILIEASLFKKTIIRYVPQEMPDLMQKEIGQKVIDQTSFHSTFFKWCENVFIL